jgi:hypothetical protein
MDRTYLSPDGAIITRLKPEVKNLWVEALRSGKYQQGQGALVVVETVTDDETGQTTEHSRRYCCLGVLTQLAVDNNVPGVRQDEDGYFQMEIETDEGHIEWVGSVDEDLPRQVCDWAGISRSNPRFANGTSAIEMNDGLGATFEDIAAAVERDL